jgi:hypothetical protein
MLEDLKARVPKGKSYGKKLCIWLDPAEPPATGLNHTSGFLT